MTTPTSTNTVARLLTTAYENAKIVGLGQDPTSEQIAKGFMRLQDLIALRQTEGMKIFTIVDKPVTLSALQKVVSFGPTGTVPMAKPYRVEQAWWEDLAGSRRPLIPLSWQEWSVLSVNASTGPITQYLEDRQEYLLNFYLWQIPDFVAASSGTLHVLLRQFLGGYVSLTDDTAFPREWFAYLAWALAEELAIAQPAQILQMCQGKAAEYKAVLEGQDVEQATVFFTLDPRGAYARDSY